jgi:hypothetical protein
VAYVELADVKAALGLAQNDIGEDTMVQLAIDAASASIDEHCGRTFGQVAATRLFGVEYGRVDVDDIASLAGLAVSLDLEGDGVHERVLAAGEYRTHPLNAPANGRPVTALDDLADKPRSGTAAVSVTGTFGWPAVPAQVKWVAHVLTLRLLSRGRGPFGTAGTPEAGARVTERAWADADADKLLEPFVRRPPVVVA